MKIFIFKLWINYQGPVTNCENTFQVAIHKYSDPQKLPHTYTVLIVALHLTHTVTILFVVKTLY